MTKRREVLNPKPVKLVIAVFWKKNFNQDLVFSKIEEYFGKIVDKTSVFSFNHTSYYEKEMGESLSKVFLEIAGLYEKNSLPMLKIKAIEIEKIFEEDKSHRAVNIDPMLVCLENVVVATTKSLPHRVYLDKGIYADVQFYRRNGKFLPLPWTYPDYTENLNFFESVRSKLL
jgi:hypothetical protein